MSAEPNVDRWRDVLLRRELTELEAREVAAWLREHPEAAAEWAMDVALTRGLRGLPSAPVSSNFTARVMAEVRREVEVAGRGTRGAQPGGRWRRWFAGRGRWLPVAGGVAVLAVTGVTGWQLRSTQRDSEYVRQVAALKAMAALPPLVLQDFDAIQRYAETAAPVDFGLLAALE